MKIYIQSKSGDHNASGYTANSVIEMMQTSRRLGFYVDDNGNCVPFEEIRYMKEEKE